MKIDWPCELSTIGFIDGNCLNLKALPNTLDNSYSLSLILRYLTRLRALDIDVVASWSLWDQADECHHAWNDNYQQGTIDVEGIPWIKFFVGINGVRHGLTEDLKRAEETTSARRRLDIGRESAEDPI